MLCGRHFLFLGALASAGLLSVHDSQEQVQLGYDMARVEEQLRRTRLQLVTERARLQALQAPPRVISRVNELRLELAPPSPLATFAPAAPPRPPAPGH